MKKPLNSVINVFTRLREKDYKTIYKKKININTVLKEMEDWAKTLKIKDV